MALETETDLQARQRRQWLVRLCLPERSLKMFLIPRDGAFRRFTLLTAGRNLRPFSTSAETLSGYEFERQTSAGIDDRPILGEITRGLFTAVFSLITREAAVAQAWFQACRCPFI